MASVGPVSIECSQFDGYQVFSEYMELIRNTTSFNETLLGQCREAICQTLWGFGVEDLSGIGVAIGYVLSIFLGILLPSFLLILPLLPLRSWLQTTLQTITTAGLASFFESAVYFALAIQIATCTILAPRDFQLMRSSAGVYEVRNAGLVSILCILPLLSAIPALTSPTASPPSTPTRHRCRRGIFLVVVAVSIYATISQLDWYFGSSVIGDGKAPGGLTYMDGDVGEHEDSFSDQAEV
ncbi:hypothetical protein QBC34DRAFT_384157 [Podospora aff. communis PSN243]|uniref:Uncharacterized protein n=1 Tax=Podospora aff. communis PSN243 TaxID=3040156 RepID=A0AAV9GAW3_9PEZI|nr:hypothetical protein QBC34DRAFT_384157 [Podospora aff. communis PSN243]